MSDFEAPFDIMNIHASAFLTLDTEKKEQERWEVREVKGLVSAK